MQWSTELEHIMRFKGCWPAVDPAVTGAASSASHAGGAALPAAPETDAAAGTSVGAAAATGTSPGTVQPDAKETREEQQAVSLIMRHTARYDASEKSFSSKSGRPGRVERLGCSVALQPALD
eukprot:TRINITY_DN3080_c0_g1_i5.p3 TRINITY_DN3080_c0_g1~~TRINITY_DN3080_c0_g1_i5.p3  ORF type:complete len:122 (-),score=17.87 TRINITY_DN3080_c0_g1_i5:669-1034(-)